MAERVTRVAPINRKSQNHPNLSLKRTVKNHYFLLCRKYRAKNGALNGCLHGIKQTCYKSLVLLLPNHLLHRALSTLLHMRQHGRRSDKSQDPEIDAQCLRFLSASLKIYVGYIGKQNSNHCKLFFPNLLFCIVSVNCKIIVVPVPSSLN